MGTWEEYYNMQTKKTKAIWKAKTFYFRENVHKMRISPRGIWTLARKAKNWSQIPKELFVFSAIRSGSTSTVKATSFEGKIQILKKHFFPFFQKASLKNLNTAYYSTFWQSIIKITPKEVKTAIQCFKPDKAPKVDEILSRFLKQVLEIFFPYFTCFFQACLDPRYHLKEFWTANIIVLKKPRKNDYSLAESYQPIAILDTLSKVLEIIFTQRLSDLTETHSLLPKQQMGVCKKRSIQITLELLVETVHTVWDCN